MRLINNSDMLSVWEAIKARRSIRKFALDDVPDEMIERMLEASRLALEKLTLFYLYS